MLRAASDIQNTLNGLELTGGGVTTGLLVGFVWTGGGGVWGFEVGGEVAVGVDVEPAPAVDEAI